MKKPTSSIPNDIPKAIVEEFSVELATPVTILFNNILMNLEFPAIWKKEINDLNLYTCSSYPPDKNYVT